jgi:hypothetical protein
MTHDWQAQLKCRATCWLTDTKTQTRSPLPAEKKHRLAAKLNWHNVLVLLLACTCTISTHAQGAASVPANSPHPETAQQLQDRVSALESEVSELKTIMKQLQARDAVSTAEIAASPAGNAAQTASSAETAAVTTTLTTKDKQNFDFLRNTTINLALDTYYAYNFNNPVGRVNLLRAYDVLSNEFSLNQADVVVEHAPDVATGQRWGGRLDLQFGQATDTLQGNPANEPRPEIYRNIFQAYGSYILPFDKGVDVDFGKWSSSLGIEGNYIKDQMNYSRSYWFSFLPFYHMGLRTSIPIGDKFSVNYWIVNGTNQVEATNGFKDELWGFTAKPAKTLTWTLNYYLGQEHPDRLPATNCGPIPVQPGLCFTAISPAPNGHTNIFDSYAAWQASRVITSFSAHGNMQRQTSPPLPLTWMAAPPTSRISGRPRSLSLPGPSIYLIGADCSVDSHRH